MNRRKFVKSMGVAGGAMAIHSLPAEALVPETTYDFKTKHLIWIINGNGSRKKEYYEQAGQGVGYKQLIREGFVYEEDNNATTSNHGHSLAELLTGNEHQSGIPLYPTPLNYVRKAYGDSALNYWFINGVSEYRRWRYRPDHQEGARPVSMTAAHIYKPDMNGTPAEVVEQEFSSVDLTFAEKRRMEEFIEATCRMRPWEFNFRHNPIPRDPFAGDAVGLAMIPHILQAFKPRMILYHQVGHDTGHGADGNLRKLTGYFEYMTVHRTTDEQLGKLVTFVKNDPYFSKNTAIVVRPEFGRDDEVNMYGELNHSVGYYQCQRSASIWWGPDFKAGKSGQLVDRKDMAPTICRIFNVEAPYASGKVRDLLNI